MCSKKLYWEKQGWNKLTYKCWLGHCNDKLYTSMGMYDSLIHSMHIFKDNLWGLFCLRR